MPSPSKTVLVFVTVNLLQFGECFAPLLKRKLGKETARQRQNNGLGPEKFRLLDDFLALARAETAEMSGISAMLRTPTLSMTAIFMMTIVSQKQPERCHVRFSNLLATWAAFEYWSIWVSWYGFIQFCCEQMPVCLPLTGKFTSWRKLGTTLCTISDQIVFPFSNVRIFKSFLWGFS